MTWAVTAVTAVSTVANYIGSRKAAKGAKRQADLEAEAEKLVTTERLRQLDIEERALYGETLARYAGSGVLATLSDLRGATPVTGSPKTILEEQAKEFAAERKITEEVGATKVQQALAEGKATADFYRWSGIANSASILSDLFKFRATI